MASVIPGSMQRKEPRQERAAKVRPPRGSNPVWETPWNGPWAHLSAGRGRKISSHACISPWAKDHPNRWKIPTIPRMMPSPLCPMLGHLKNWLAARSERYNRAGPRWSPVHRTCLECELDHRTVAGTEGRRGKMIRSVHQRSPGELLAGWVQESNNQIIITVIERTMSLETWYLLQRTKRPQDLCICTLDKMCPSLQTDSVLFTVIDPRKQSGEGRVCPDRSGWHSSWVAKLAARVTQSMTDGPRFKLSSPAPGLVPCSLWTVLILSLSYFRKRQLGGRKNSCH